MESVALASRRSSHPLCYQHRRDAGATGFSFAEVMFAVVILGIGFIMIAAIFPVAIQQSQVTNNENLATAVARESANTFSALPHTYPNPLYDPGNLDLAVTVASKFPDEQPTLCLFPATVKNYAVPLAATQLPPAVVAPLSGPRWEAIKDNLILPSDRRYAYIPFYRRENNSNSAEIIVISVAVQNHSIYQANIDTAIPSLPPPTGPTFTPGIIPPAPPATTTIYPDTITIPTGAPRPGYYVTSTLTGTDSHTDAVSQVRTYRIGRPINLATGLFELDTPDDYRRTTGSLITGGDGLWGTRDDVRDSTFLANAATARATPTMTPNSTLQPVPAFAQLTFPSDSVAGRITLYDMIPSTSGLVPPAAAAEGAFVIIADDYPYEPDTTKGYNPTTGHDIDPAGVYAQPLQVTHTPIAPYTAVVTHNTGQSNGHVYRLGQLVPPNPTGTPPVPVGTYDLDPSFGMEAVNNTSGISADQLPLNTAAPAGPLAKVFLIGRGRTNSQDINSDYSGNAQDVAVFRTYVPVQ